MSNRYKRKVLLEYNVRNVVGEAYSSQYKVWQRSVESQGINCMIQWVASAESFLVCRFPAKEGKVVVSQGSMHKAEPQGYHTVRWHELDKGKLHNWTTKMKESVNDLLLWDLVFKKFLEVNLILLFVLKNNISVLLLRFVVIQRCHFMAYIRACQHCCQRSNSVNHIIAEIILPMNYKKVAQRFNCHAKSTVSVRN